MSLTKAESRKLARLEAENAELRETLSRIQSRSMDSVRGLVAYRVAFAEMAELMAEAKEFAQ